ncbi:TMF family protein [Spirosoma litoris]
MKHIQALGQIIDVPAGSPLTINSNINLPTGYSLQYNAQTILRGPVAGSFNTYLGIESGNSTQGTQNTFIGYQTGFSNTGGANTFLGYLTGRSNTSGTGNTFLGNQAGNANTTGQANVFLGSQAGFNNTTGTGNLFLGQQAGYSSIGSYNLFMGNAAGSGTTTGLGNTAIGDGALLHNTTGQHTTAIGRYAGVNSNGDYNVLIGFAADVNSGNTGITNAVAIGAYTQVNQSNSIILGSNARVGIGTSAPQNKLEITPGTANQSGLRLTNLTSNSPASALNQNKFLSVNSSGDVILVSSGSARLGAELWTASGEYVQTTNGEGVIIGSKMSRTPTGYKLYVEDGILTEKLKVAVKNTADWSDFVFKANYKLQPLKQVEQYIRKHEHLPGVPSALEVVSHGLDVAKMDAQLLKKIEELTLYSIQLEKANQEQQAINKQQQLVNQRLQAEIEKLKKRFN